MRRIILSWYVLAAMLVVSGVASAQTTYWHPTGGPAGGQTKGIAIDSTGRVWLCFEKGGMFVSTDSGDFFTPVNKHLAQPGLWPALQASADGYIYVITNNQHYVPRLNTNLPRAQWQWDTLYPDAVGGPYNYLLTTSPENWLFCDGATGSKGGHSVRRSTDHGNTWTDFIDSLQDQTVTVFAHGAPGVYAAMTGGIGGVLTHEFWYTKDNGAHWAHRSDPTQFSGAGPLIDTSDGLKKMIIANNGNILVSTSQKSTFHGAADSTYRSGRIYISTDTGKTWKVTFQHPKTPVFDFVKPGEFQKNIDDIVLVPTTGEIYAAPHLYKIRSTDNGVTWMYGDSSNQIEDDPEALAATKEGTIVDYIVEPFGFYRSTDHAKTFVYRANGFHCGYMWGMAIDSRQYLYTETEDNLYRSTDQGASWPLPHFYGKSEPAEPSIAVTKLDDIFLNGSFGIWRSQNHGDTLGQILGSGTDRTTSWYSPVQQSTTRLFTYLLKVNQQRPILYSANRGNSWDTLKSYPSQNNISCIAAQGDSLLIAGLSNDFYLSTDEGNSEWFTQTTNAEISQPHKMLFRNADHSILAMIKGSTAGLLASAGIWQSLDGGKHWNHIFPPPTDIARKIFSPPNYLPPTDYYGLNIDSHGALFVCSDSGIFHSNNDISDWANVSTGLNWGNWDSSRYINVTEVVENTVTHRFYASSRAQGVYESVPDLNSVRPGITPSASPTIVNYPNPFNAMTTIAFTTSVDGWAQVFVYDVIGRMVSKVTAGTYTSGDHHVVFDGSTLAPGNYMIVLRDASGDHIGWMTIAR